MPSIAHMAHAITRVEGSNLSTPFYNRLYRRLLRMGQDSPLRLTCWFEGILAKRRKKK